VKHRHTPQSQLCQRSAVNPVVARNDCFIKAAAPESEKLAACIILLRDSVRAKLRILGKRTLKRWKYPPVGEEAAIDLVLEQAEALSNAWSTE